MPNLNSKGNWKFQSSSYLGAVFSRVKTKVAVFSIDVSCIDASLWKNGKLLPGLAYGTYSAHAQNKVSIQQQRNYS